MNARIALLGRSPVLGQVKTRLASELGQNEALRLHEAMLDLMCRRLSNWAPDSVTLWVDRQPEHPFVCRCLDRYQLSVNQQRGHHLGDRLLFALNTERATGNGATRFALAIGGDCVGLQRADLDEALTGLATGSQVVLGPATDGGYYLIGVDGDYPALFRDIEWGSSCVLEQTLDRARSLGLACRLLPERPDVDRAQDLQLLDSHTRNLLMTAYPL